MQKYFVGEIFKGFKFSAMNILTWHKFLLKIYVGSLPRDVSDHGVTSAAPVSHVGMAKFVV